MTFRHRLLPGLVAMLLLASVAHAQATANSTQVGIQPVKANLQQPYIVKKGDTLWDIANYFFKDPMQWLNIWEDNLYITNPDLIYPGNKIWFDSHRKSGLTIVRPSPEVILRPVQRLKGNLDSPLLLTAMQRQDFIQPEQEQGVGYVLASPDERLNYGLHDHIYLKLNHPTPAGTLFDIFRSTDTIKSPKTGKKLGVLVEDLGQVRVEAQENGIYPAIITRAFAEISRGDRVKPARSINLYLQPTQAQQQLSGSIVYIRGGAHEAAQNQVIGVDLGKKHGMKAGTQLSIMRTGRTVRDPVSGKPVQLPPEKIGDALVLVPQTLASIALITDSTAPIYIGDTVIGGPEQ